MPDLRVRLEQLRGAAWRAAEVIPSLEELKASPDFSLRAGTAVAASDVRALLGGHSVQVWREYLGGVDPSRHLLWGSSAAGGKGDPEPFSKEADDWTHAFADGPEPWTPTDYQRPPERDRGETEVVLSATRAAVLAELLDELAVRLSPGLRSGMIHYSSYDLAHFIGERFWRELTSHGGF
ncbi:hypothetical protein [Streptomyces sp. MB09-02B]|uniref:hypothetical protein n=1 Tax=Streptomyces sp. MB09-02B TaxID=3028667 RepID=UPI0029A85D36|nr:hypothetical protein [Streptomyces sp. MB09-02B]MDX3641730.1 hypothetical protein [Streptomyces sp. MB09-02B]